MLITELPAKMTYMEKPSAGTIDYKEYSRLENVQAGLILMYRCSANCEDCILSRKLICPVCMSEFKFRMEEPHHVCRCGAVLKYCVSYCVWAISIPIIKSYPEDII